ncbi:MAG: outer membrane beta-barrel protein [Pseudomonadota bacterium]
MKPLNPHIPKLLALSLCALPLSSFAADANDELSYGYVEADYINLDIDQEDENLNIFKNDFDNGGGYGLTLSFPINDAFFVFGDYTDTESDFNFSDNSGVVVPSNTDIKRLNLGVGFVMPMNDTSDLVLSGAYSDLDYGDFDLGGRENDFDVEDLEDSFDDLNEDPSDGYFVDAKFRTQFAPAWEGSLGLRYTDIEDADGVSVIGNVMYEFGPNWGLNLSIDAGDELVTWGAGVRYIF